MARVFSLTREGYDAAAKMAPLIVEAPTLDDNDILALLSRAGSRIGPLTKICTP